MRYEKLRDYIEINMHFRLRKLFENVDLNWNKEFRNCNFEDFSSRNYSGASDPGFSDEVHANFCPDIDKNFSSYVVAEKYTNTTFRQSFSVEIQLCDSGRNSACKNTTEIDALLTTFYFTFFTLQQRAEFTSNNLGKYPLTTTNSFHSQFQLFSN